VSFQVAQKASTIFALPLASKAGKRLGSQVLLQIRKPFSTAAAAPAFLFGKEVGKKPMI
jgi:hypothetical protein